MTKVTIIGGGIIGLFTAYYLVQQDVEVTILDQGSLSQGCSTGNAGMIVPSHIIPLASPGMITKGLKWMLSPKSPFYIQPRLDKKLLQWCLLFYRSATKKHVQQSIPYLKNLGLLSKSLYIEFSKNHPDSMIGLEEKGLIMLYKTLEMEKEEIEMAHLANQHGLEAQILSLKEVQDLEPEVKLNVRGAVHFTGDAHLDPSRLHGFLRDYLIAKGVKLIPHTEVIKFEKKDSVNLGKVITTSGNYQFDQLVICAGAWSGVLAGKLGIRLPLLSGKGYSFMQENQPSIKYPAILTEHKVAVTPFGDSVRFGGTMEITNINQHINQTRVKGIFESIQPYYENFSPILPEQKEIWTGLRPCSPDGLPYIGPTKKLNNVFFGSGHSMMGVSLAPATGKVLAAQILDKKIPFPADAFSPDRYS
jgi:D-amino-acid dehydrogenase